MRQIYFIIIMSLLFLHGVSCGSEEAFTLDSSVATDALPYVNRINPASGQVGDTITIFGFGFSNGAPSNIVHVGGTAVAAATYALINSPTSTEIEQLTFAIPAGAATGAAGIAVTVFDNTSNAGVQLTINP